MRKNFFRTFVAGFAMACLMTVPAFAESGTVTGSYVNIRSGPGTNYGVVECLSRGTELTVTDRSNSSWYAVEYNGLSGFMSSGYLSVTEEVYIDVPVADSGAGSNGYINAMYVRFRSGPGSAYSILGEYNKGKAVTITGSYGDWTACSIDGRAGYVFSSYLSSGSYSAPNYSGSSYEDIYLDSYIPNVNDEYLVTPLPSPVATAIPVVIPTEAPDERPEIIPTEIPVPTENVIVTPEPTEEPAPSPVATPAPTPVPVEPEQQVKGFINANYVRFRTGPSTGYSIIDSYNKGTSLMITGYSGEWTVCEINGISGYVFSQYVTKTTEASVVLPGVSEDEQEEVEVPTETSEPEPTPTPVVEVESKAGYVSGNNVRMRAGASMSSEIIAELNYGNEVTITGISGDWTAVIYDGEEGFIYSQYVQEGEYRTPETPSIDTSATGSELGRQVADYALQFVGYNYCWGGKSPDTGFDCSGLVYYVYQQFGYTLNRVAADQALNGVHVDELQPGDVLCFYSGSSYIGHSGIYIGDGKFVHAANSATGVIVTSLEGYYSARGYEARRIV